MRLQQTASEAGTQILYTLHIHYQESGRAPKGSYEAWELCRQQNETSVSGSTASAVNAEWQFSASWKVASCYLGGF